MTTTMQTALKTSYRTKFTDKLSTDQGTYDFLIRAGLVGYHDAWKEVVGIPKDGDNNPTPGDQLNFIEAVLDFGLQQLRDCPWLPCETFPHRNGTLCTEGRTARWLHLLNWHLVYVKLTKEGVKRLSYSKVMKSLVDAELIPIWDEPDWEAIASHVAEFEVSG